MGILNNPEVLKIGIKDCGEQLMVLSDPDFVLEPMYFKWGVNSSPEIKLRTGVIDRLKHAKKILNLKTGCENWNFKIWDGYRILTTQKKIYDDYFGILKKRHPDWSNEILHEKVQIFVSPPSHNPKLPAPHNTGGAVDMTIIDSDGEELPMGSKFDEFNPRSFTDHFKNGDDDISEIEENVERFSRDGCLLFKSNRELFIEVMSEAGFVNYFEEWWHFSYGDLEWARQTGSEFAIYGSMEL